MTYALSGALQQAVFGALQADVVLTGLVGDNIFDAAPEGPLPETYVSLGPEQVRDAGDVSGAGAWHDFEVSVVTEIHSFLTAKQVAGAICDALLAAELSPVRGRVTGLWFRKARATRASGGRRRIDLTFGARMDDDSPP